MHLSGVSTICGWLVWAEPCLRSGHEPRLLRRIYSCVLVRVRGEGVMGEYPRDNRDAFEFDRLRTEEAANRLLSAENESLALRLNVAESERDDLQRQLDEAHEAIKEIPAATLPDLYSEHPDLVWREDVLAALGAAAEEAVFQRHRTEAQDHLAGEVAELCNIAEAVWRVRTGNNTGMGSNIVEEHANSLLNQIRRVRKLIAVTITEAQS